MDYCMSAVKVSNMTNLAAAIRQLQMHVHYLYSGSSYRNYQQPRTGTSYQLLSLSIFHLSRYVHAVRPLSAAFLALVSDCTVSTHSGQPQHSKLFPYKVVVVITFLSLLLCRGDTILKAAEKVAAAVGPEGLQLLINNAGLMELAPLECTDLAEVRSVAGFGGVHSEDLASYSTECRLQLLFADGKETDGCQSSSGCLICHSLCSLVL